MLEQRGMLVDKELSLLSVKVEPPELSEVVRYALELRGKKIRACLVTLACEAVGGSVLPALVPAVVVEMVHNTSLILDDVIDRSDLRRGRKTINSRWGNDMALIACDALLALAIRQIARTDVRLTTAIIESASGSLLQLAEGEALTVALQGGERATSASRSARPRRCSGLRRRPGPSRAKALTRKSPHCGGTANAWASPSRSGTTCSTSSRVTWRPASPG